MSARVGLIIPSSNRMVEQEMVHAFPQGVTPHVTRLRMTGPNRMGHDQLIPRVEEATRSLADAKCDVVAFHCTANSMEEGQGGEARILAAVEGSGARHATTTATAIRRAPGRRRLFPELRQYFGIRHHRGPGGAPRQAGHHQQPDRDLGRADAARRARPPRLPGTIVRSRRRCGGGAGGATCVTNYFGSETNFGE